MKSEMYGERPDTSFPALFFCYCPDNGSRQVMKILILIILL